MEPVLERDPGPPEVPEDTSLDGRRTRKGRSGLKLYTCATLTLALLCVLQATLNISLHLHSATSWTKGREHLMDSLDDLTRLGWLYFDQSLYFISTAKKNWEASRDFCLNSGADLLVINSKEEQDFVMRFREDSWIGLSDRDTEGTWKWVDGTNLTSTVWLSGEPNDFYGAEDCALAKGGGWNDDTCAKLYSWICEKKVVVLDHLDAELKKQVTHKKQEEAPHIISPPSTKIVSVGDTAQFSCHARGRPEPTIEWLYNGRPLKRDREDQSQLAVLGDGGDLVVKGVRPGVDTVSCVANNSAGTANHTTELLVFGVTSDGWRFFNRSLYFISTTKRNWTASRDHCLQRNADLVVINSKGEQEFATKWQNSFWIGLRLDRDTDKTWKWVDGTNVTLSSWLSGEPNNYHGAEDCAVAWNSGWYDGICSAHYSWICEKVVALDNLEMK